MHFSAQRNISMLLGRMEAHRRVEFTVGSGPVAVAAQHGKEATPAQLGEGARSVGEPLVQALLRWFARDRGRQRHCAAVRGPLGPPHHGPLTARPMCRRAETLARTAERRGGGGVALEA